MTQRRSWVVVTVDGNIAAVADNAGQWFGMMPQMVLHRFIHINDQITWLSFLADLRNGITPNSVSLRLQKNNEASYISVVFSCRAQQGDGFFIAIDDFEENSIKPLFATAHELRTPLNAIIGFSDLMLHCPVDEEKVRSYASTIRQAGVHLLNVVETVLQNAEASRITACTSDAVQVIHNSLVMLRPLQGNKTITSAVSDEKIIVAIDETALRQIIFNLIANALKFTAEQGKIHITLEATVGNKLLLTVTDDGCGMHEQDVAQITRPFARFAQARENKIQGTGLGLSLVHDLVQRFEGALSFESQWQKGMKVTITLPLVELYDEKSGTIVNFNELQSIPMNKTDIYNAEKNETKENLRSA